MGVSPSARAAGGLRGSGRCGAGMSSTPSPRHRSVRVVCRECARAARCGPSVRGLKRPKSNSVIPFCSSVWARYISVTRQGSFVKVIRAACHRHVAADTHDAACLDDSSREGAGRDGVLGQGGAVDGALGDLEEIRASSSRRSSPPEQQTSLLDFGSAVWRHSLRNYPWNNESHTRRAVRHGSVGSTTQLVNDFEQGVACEHLRRHDRSDERTRRFDHVCSRH